MDTHMQRENEISRVVLEGRRIDDGDRCSVILIRESGGTWAFYPHGAARLGVRLGTEEAITMTRAILAGSSQDPAGEPLTHRDQPSDQPGPRRAR